jgi:hypothetical protein
VAAAPALSIATRRVPSRGAGPDAIDRWAMGETGRFCADLVTARHGPADGSLPDLAIVAR